MCNTCGCKSAEGMNDSLFDEAQHFFEHMEKASTNALSLMQMGAIETGNYMVHIDTVIANLEARMRDYLKQSGMLNESQMDRLNIDAPMKGKIMYKAEGSCSNCGSALVMNAEGEHSCGCGTESYGGETFEAPIRQATVNPQWAKNMLDDYVAEDVLATINSLEVLRNKLAKMEGKDINEMDNKPRKIELTLEGQISMTPENITQIILALKNQYLESAGYATEESDVVGFVGDGRQIGFLDAENDPDFDEEKADRNKDGKISDWERAVGNAVAKAIRENKEKKGAEDFEAETRNRYGNRYITRDSKGRFKKNVSVGRSLKADRRRKAKRVPSKSGQGDKGDYNGEDMSLKDSAKLGFGVGAGLLGFNLTLLGIAAVGGFLLNRD